MSQVVRRQFGHITSQKTFHPLLVNWCLCFVAIILAFCDRSLAIRTRQKKEDIYQVEITWGRDEFSLIVMLFPHIYC